MPTQQHPPDSIETPLLRLRRVRLADAPAMFEFESDPQVTRFLVMRTESTMAEAERHAADRVFAWNEGRRWVYAITLSGDDRAIGRIGLKSNPDGMTVGYALARRLHGQGFASEALRALCPAAATMTDKLFARVDTDNAASIRVLEKCGFSRVEMRPRALVMPNIAPEPRDYFVYAKPLRQETRD